MHSKDLNHKLKLGILINAVFTCFEFFAGFFSGSLALMADAAQNLTDVLSLSISFVAFNFAKKDPTLKKTYGYGRATILAALLNGCILLMLSFLIFYKAYQRFGDPEPIEGGIVMLIGFLGIVVNAGVASLFLNHRDDLNIQSAFINMLYDALASAGALIAGLIIYLTKTSIADPLISMCIGTLLLFSAFRIINDALHILFEGVPKHIDISLVSREIKNITGVLEINQLHVWAISSPHIALSCQIIIDIKDLMRSPEIVKNIKKRLLTVFNIQDSTIEVDLSECRLEDSALHSKLSHQQNPPPDISASQDTSIK